jgi:lauroyl/myristoyl acyltransferase
MLIFPIRERKIDGTGLPERRLMIQDLYFLLLIVLARLTSWRPFSNLEAPLIRLLGEMAYRLSSNKRERMLRVLTDVFGAGLDDGKKREVARSSFRNFWENLFSIAPSPQDLNSLDAIDFHGECFLKGGLDKGTGVILWESNAFGRRLIAKQYLHRLGYRLYQLHSENHLEGLNHPGIDTSWVKRKVIKSFFDTNEKEFVEGTLVIPQSESLAFTRSLTRLLNRNCIICSAADGREGRSSIPVEFFGKSRMFPTGMISLARITEAPLLPIFCFEKPGGSCHLVIEGPICPWSETDAERGQSTRRAAREYLAHLESYARRFPGQYRGWHLIGS